MKGAQSVKTYQWLLMDADNTLFDFDAAEDTALTRTLLHFGVPADPPAKACYRACNKALWEAFERGEITQADIMAQRFTRFLAAMALPGDGAAWNDHYVHALAQCPQLLSGALELCRRAAGQYTLALATNGVPFIQRSRLENSPIAPCFGSRVFISGEMGCRKPDKAYFDLILTALGAQDRRSEVLVVGDSLSSDILGARNSGLDSLWLNRSAVQPGPVRPTYEVNTLAQLSEFLDAHHH